jgi:hypothetical protein
MKKDKIYSFSDEAKAIMRRFPRRETDTIEKQDYEQAMQQLVQMQEQVRNEMGLNNQQQEYKCGGKMKMDGTAPTQFVNPIDYSLGFLGNSLVPNPSNPTIMNLQQTPSMNRMSIDEAMVAADADKIAGNVGNIGDISPITAINKPTFWDKNKQYAPYAISGLSNVASNLLLANIAKKNKSNYAPVTATPERINMEPYAEQMRKEAGVTKNIAMRNARNLGLNAGATLANMGAIGADVDRGLGANLTNLYGQQEQYNVGTANQFNLANTNTINQGRMFNTQVDLANKEAQLGYLSGALGTLPGVMKDIRMDKADKEMRSILDKYYTNMGGNYKNKGKSIWDDEAFQYMVANLPNDVKDNLLRKYSKEIGG